MPLVGAQLGRGVEALSRRGEDVLAQNLEPLRALITVVAVQIVDRVLAELDLTALVRERVDIDAVVRDVEHRRDHRPHRSGGAGRRCDRRCGSAANHPRLHHVGHRRRDDRCAQSGGAGRRSGLGPGRPDAGPGRAHRTVTTAEVRTAGIVSRGAAGVIDVLVVLVGLAALYVGWLFIRLAFSPRAFSFPSPSVIFSTLGFLAVATLYLAVCWAISGCTAGAVIMGVQVVGRAARPTAARHRTTAGAGVRRVPDRSGLGCRRSAPTVGAGRSAGHPRGVSRRTDRAGVESGRRPTRYQVCMTPLPLTSTSPRSVNSNSPRMRS